VKIALGQMKGHPAITVKEIQFTMISLRKSYETAAVNPGPLSNGIRAWSKVNPSSARNFPFSSLRSLCKAFHSPNQFNYTEESPSDVDVPQGPDGKWDNQVQGIARDEQYWYLVTRDAIWYFGDGPVKPLPPSQEATVENSGITFRGRRQLVNTEADLGPVHMSAPALVDELQLLLVPAEGNCMPEDGDLLWVWVFDTRTLGYLGRIAVKTPVKNIFPWCAVSQDRRLLYTSAFDNDANTDVVSVYRLPDLEEEFLGSGIWPVHPSENLAIYSLGDWPHYYRSSSLYPDAVGSLRITDVGGVPNKFGHIQGGCVSPNGHLYLSFEKIRKEGGVEDCEGVLGFDLLTGQGVQFISSEHGEMEGVFVGTDGKADLHVLHANGGSFTISHFAADRPADA
jgi:hypothetical protein